MKSSVYAIVILSLIVLVGTMMSPPVIERYITKKSHLLAAGVSLQEPHVRALNTGMR